MKNIIKSFTIQGIILFNLILYLPINSSPWFSKKNKVLQSKTFSNLVFGDDFYFDRDIWLYYDFLFILGEIFHTPMFWRTKEKSSMRQSRSKAHGSLLTQHAKLIRMSLLLGIHYSKHSRINISKCCCKMMGLPN